MITKINPWFCPNCGARLIRKTGRFGDFMACPGYPDCRYTRALWTYSASHIKPYCDKCNKTGLIPFVNKDGKTISHAWVNCECHEDEPECYFPVSSEDFDFPISYSVYRSLCWHHGWQDPGPDELPPIQEEIKPVFKPRPVDDEIDQLKAGFLFLQNKLNKHIDASKKKLSKYKGLAT